MAEQPLKSEIMYIVEERLLTKPDDTAFAWCQDTPEDAEKLLVKLNRQHGHERLYRAFTNIEV